jgi:hypothetical protein
MANEPCHKKGPGYPSKFRSVLLSEASVCSALSPRPPADSLHTVELSAKPSLLFFLDEPTSGLDGQVG